MARHRIHRTRSIAFKRRFVHEYLAGETLHGGAFDEDAETAATAFFLRDSPLGRLGRPSKP